MEFEKKITCIDCPLGCSITVRYKKNKKNKIIKVIGNQCKKGIKFAKDEIIGLRWILTTTITIKSAKINRLPVRSDVPVKKEKIIEMVKEIKKVKISPPVKMGDTVAKNFMHSGVDIISSMSISE